MEQKKKIINGTTYLVTQMDGVRALKTQTKLMSLLGPSLFSVLDTKGLKSENLLESLAPIMENFDDEKANELVLSLFENGVFIEKKTGKEGVKASIPVDFETHFSGKIMEMWKVVGFILETNFSVGK